MDTANTTGLDALLIDPSTPVTDLTLIDLRDVPDEEAATALDARMTVLEGQYKRTFAERGLIAREVRERRLWQHVESRLHGAPMRSMDQWIAERCPQSRSDVYRSMKVIDELLEDVPEQDLIEMPRANMETMRKLSSAVRQQPETLEAAKTMTEKQFVAHMAAQHPDQHVEMPKAVHWKFAPSAWRVIEQALQEMREREGVATDEEAVEGWAIEYLDGLHGANQSEA